MSGMLWFARKLPTTYIYALMFSSSFTMCFNSSMSGVYCCKYLSSISLTMQSTSCDVCSKQPSNYVVSLLSLTKMRFIFFPKKAPTVCRFSMKFEQLLEVMSNGKPASRQSVS